MVERCLFKKFLTLTAYENGLFIFEVVLRSLAGHFGVTLTKSGHKLRIVKQRCLLKYMSDIGIGTNSELNDSSLIIYYQS